MTKTINKGILSLIGSTPLIQLTHVYEDLPFRVFAKLEGLNPGGSVKDWPALNMIKQAQKQGKISQNTVVIESSSGNLGIGLAQVCRYFGLRFICVVDPKTTKQNINIIKAYGFVFTTSLYNIVTSVFHSICFFKSLDRRRRLIVNFIIF